ncbi:DENN domain-containing protein 3 [Bienertia sinuspersici]
MVFDTNIELLVSLGQEIKRERESKAFLLNSLLSMRFGGKHQFYNDPQFLHHFPTQVIIQISKVSKNGNESYLDSGDLVDVGINISTARNLVGSNN